MVGAYCEHFSHNILLGTALDGDLINVALVQLDARCTFFNEVAIFSDYQAAIQAVSNYSEAPYSMFLMQCTSSVR